MTLMLEKMLSHYRILKKLGAGGMGEVYLAEDTRLDRKVAIKLLPAESVADEQAKKRLVREAKAAAKLDHPNICSIYEVGEADGHTFIVMQYIEGETLASRIHRKPLELGEALDIAAQAADALSEAHSRGIIHRDIKPANIMITSRGHMKVMDFGLAKLIRGTSLAESQAVTESLLTEPGVIVGTVPYMAPEQVKGESIDARSDIFSFGCLLYEMVSGRQPFVSESPAATFSAILTSEPPPLARFARQTPDELERIIIKALRKDREERYQGIKDMLLDLRSLKHRLEFEAELERSRPPASDSPAVTTNSGTAATLSRKAAQTAEVIEKPASRITRHRQGVIVAVAALVIAAALLAYIFLFAPTASAIDSIAVLPLVNASNDPGTEYLSDGISESLINSLTELQQLRVVARTTAFRYKGREVDPQAVGRELNVRAVLTGRVRQAGDRLNIQVDLVDASTGAQLWGEEYERRVEDVLTVKQAIAREVTDKLRLKLSGDEQQQLAKRDTTNAEAYQFYLRGRYYWNKRTADGIRKAIAEFQQATERDPNYALGYVGLADSYVLLAAYAGVPSSETLPKARAAADRALQIDESLAEAHTSLAEIHLRQWRWAEAEQEFRRAIALNPNYPTAHHWFSIYFRVKGQFDEALSESKRAHELDPLSLIISSNLANAYHLKNDINSTIEQSQKAIELDPRFPNSHHNLGWVYLKQGRDEEATAGFQKAVDFSSRASSYLSSLGYCYAVTGRRGEALQILGELEERYDRREALGIHLAGLCIGLGEKDQAFAWLEKDFKQRSSVLPEVRWWYNFGDLRSDPRYADLLRRIGVTQ